MKRNGVCVCVRERGYRRRGAENAHHSGSRVRSWHVSMFSGGFDNIVEDDFDFDEDEIADEEFLQLFFHGLVSVCLLTCPLQSLDVSRKKKLHSVLFRI